MDLSKYDLKNAKANDFDALPAGEYKVVVIEMKEKPTKDGGGVRMEVKLQVCSGQYQNRTLFDGLNVVNKSAQAQAIGRGQLKALCVACGKEDPKTTEELYGKPIIAKVKVGKDQNGNPRNEIAGYKALVTPSAPAAKAPNLVEQAFGEGEPVASGPKANPWG